MIVVQDEDWQKSETAHCFYAFYKKCLSTLLVLQGEKDWQKYETARRLHKTVDKIRAQYREDWKSKEMRVRQRSVALYFIDKVSLALSSWAEMERTYMFQPHRF